MDDLRLQREKRQLREMIHQAFAVERSALMDLCRETYERREAEILAEALVRRPVKPSLRLVKG